MILLINPPFYRFQGLEQDYVPLSLLAVGSSIKANGTDVFIKNMEVFDGAHYEGYADRKDSFDRYIAGLNNDNHPAWTGLHELIDTLKPDVIGISVLNVKFHAALKIMEIAKMRGIPVIVGGTHPTIEPERYPDFVDIRPGEFESNGGRIANLDDLPFPAYDILLDKYSPNGYGHLMSSRGCPFGCKFCASQNIWKRKVTFKSPRRMVMEMKDVHTRFGTNCFTFWDETFTLNHNRLTEFCMRFMESGINATWRCDTRADSLTDDVVKMMKRSRCESISMGVEVGDDYTLGEIGKGETTETIAKAAGILNDNGMPWKAYSIIGFPSDTEELIFRSMEFIKNLRPSRITLNFFTPYKGTELYDTVDKLGMINGTYHRSLLAHHSPHNYFCPKIEKKRYNEIKGIVAADIDAYNQRALEVWK